MLMTTLTTSSIINENLRLIPEIGNVIPYDDLMEFLFGNKVNDIPKMELLNKGFLVDSLDEDLVIKNTDSIMYFKLEKFEEFLILCSKRINFDNINLCPINYNYCLQNLVLRDIECSERFKKLYNLLSDFKDYISTKTIVDKDINSDIIKNLYWNDIFKGTVVSTNEEPYMVTIKFRKREGYPFVLNITETPTNSKNTLSLMSLGSSKEEEFRNLYKQWCQEVLMENCETYVKYCLEYVTGSADLAKFIFESHEDKTSCIINLNDLNNIINFKSNSKKKEYIQNFKMMYNQKFIYEEEGEEIKLNFEGFNKYLLNLETSFLKTFEDKEVINTLYYNVMDELVNSYKRLYKYTKLI